MPGTPTCCVNASTAARGSRHVSRRRRASIVIASANSNVRSIRIPRRRWTRHATLLSCNSFQLTSWTQSSTT